MDYICYFGSFGDSGAEKVSFYSNLIDPSFFEIRGESILILIVLLLDHRVWKLSLHHSLSFSVSFCF